MNYYLASCGCLQPGTRAMEQTAIGLVLFSLCPLVVPARPPDGAELSLPPYCCWQSATDYKVFGSGRWFNAGGRRVWMTISSVWDRRRRRCCLSCHVGEPPLPCGHRRTGRTPFRSVSPWGGNPGRCRPCFPCQYKQRIGQWVPFNQSLVLHGRTKRRHASDLGVRMCLVNGAAHDPVWPASPNFRLIVEGTCFATLRVSPPSRRIIGRRA